MVLHDGTIRELKELGQICENCIFSIVCFALIWMNNLGLLHWRMKELQKCILEPHGTTTIEFCERWWEKKSLFEHHTEFIGILQALESSLSLRRVTGYTSHDLHHSGFSMELKHSVVNAVQYVKLRFHLRQTWVTILPDEMQFFGSVLPHCHDPTIGSLQINSTLKAEMRPTLKRLSKVNRLESMKGGMGQIEYIECKWAKSSESVQSKLDWRFLKSSRASISPRH